MGALNELKPSPSAIWIVVEASFKSLLTQDILNTEELDIASKPGTEASRFVVETAGRLTQCLTGAPDVKLEC